MNYNVKGTDVSVTDELRSYVEKCLEHADKYVSGDSTAHADVECEYAPVRDGGRYRAEFTISAGGDVFRAESWGTTLHEALDLATNTLSREMRRSKRKRIHILRHGAVKMKEYLRGWRSRP